MTGSRVATAQRQAVPAPLAFQRHSAQVGAALRDALRRDHPAVYDMLRFHMGWAGPDGRPPGGTEGKALRPALCLFACEAVGGIAGQAMPAAVALEFVHNFSLIHDDIQDRDATRHQRATLWARWGMPKALVAGNVLRVVADLTLHDLRRQGVATDRALAVARLLTDAYLEMIEGQHLDLTYEGRLDLDLDDYLGMVARKTGALFRCSLHVGALIGTTDQATAQAFRECGGSLGYVFQVRDDVLGIWGDAASTGKPVGADIRRRKGSLPVVFAMGRAAGADRDTLKRVYRKGHVSDGDVGAVLGVLARVGAREFARDLAAEHSAKAIAALRGTRLAAQRIRDVEGMVEFLLARER